MRAGGDGGAVNDGGADKDRVIPSKENSIGGKRVKIGGVLRCDEVRPMPSKTTTTTCLAVPAATVARDENSSEEIISAPRKKRRRIVRS